MITLIKNNPIKLFLIGLLSVILGLNYFGFCFRSAHILSDEEKIEIAVKYILHAQTAINRDSFLGELIPYRDREEFFSLNPGCCVVATFYRTSGGEGIETSCWGRLTGFNSSTVGIKYLARYRDKNGLMKTVVANVAPGISNCGKLN